MMSLKYILTALLILWLTLDVPARAQFHHSPKVNRDDGTRRGLYYNCGFGYAFNIPKGFVGRGEPNGHPQHGVRILLSEQPESYVWVDGSFSSIEWQTLDDAGKSYREAFNEREKDVSIVESQVTRLGRLRALRLTFSYRGDGADGRLIEEVILARRRSKGEAEIVYKIGLRTPHSSYKRGRRMLENVLRTWQFKPLPCA